VFSSRGIGLTIGLTIAALIVGGWHFAFGFGLGGGGSAQSIGQLIGSVTGQNVAPQFRSAAAILDAYHQQHGTYVGEVLPSTGVVVVGASQASYCLQSGAGTTVVHQVEPGGSLMVGACPP
jgi:hypothetical protein